MAAYLALDGRLPDDIIRNVVVPTNEDVQLVRVFIGEDRQGPANVHEFDPEAMYDQALEGPDAEPKRRPPARATAAPASAAVGAAPVVPATTTGERRSVCDRWYRW